MRQVTPLTDGWILRHPDGTGEALPASVPGCVHTDLLAAGLIPDPFLGRGETEVAWVGRRAWTYERDLAAGDSAHERTDLVFDGLDTVAEILLDGRPLGRVRNMHRSYRFDVTGLSGRLTVRFASAYDEAEAVRAAVGDRPGAYAEPYQYVRKMACSFGWDWGPPWSPPGSGGRCAWSTGRRPGSPGCVRWSPWRTARAWSTWPSTSGAPGRGAARGRGVRRRRARPRPDRGTAGTVRLRVPDARLWWPRGYGEQPLYDVEVRLLHAGEAVDTWRRRIGFRTVELDTSADAHGTGFTLVVNGERLFARGVNWIPDDAFPSRITRDRYRRRLEQAAAAGVDLVRVWGGGIYESEDFYDACDELGLLVWQDFPFACAAYPEEQPLRGEVEAEARENVVRLMPHPSLVLWNGNNENLWGFRDWDWEPALAGDSWGEGYYLGLLPRVVAEVDPTRPYTAGSPWSGSWLRHPNDPAHGTHHSWEVWNRRDYADYRLDVPRFVAEFGWQAPPAYATLRRALPGEELAPDSPACCTTRRRRTATASWSAVSPGTSPCPRGISTAGTI